MPASIRKHGGRAVTAMYPMHEIFALLIATFVKSTQMCSMSPTVRMSAGAALKVLGITVAAWSSSDIARFVIEPCLRKLADAELSPYISKLMAKADGKEGRRAKALEFLREITLHFIYHIGQADAQNPVVDYESFSELCKKARINEILQFTPLGGCAEHSVDNIIFEEDWDNSTLQDVPRIARFPDDVFLTVHASLYKIKRDEWLSYMLTGDRKLARIEQVGTRRRRQTAGQRMAGERAAEAAAELHAEEDEFAAGEEDQEEAGEEADDGMARQQRQRTPGSSRRGMGAAGMPNGLDPTRQGARESHERHYKQALGIQSKEQMNNKEARAPPASPACTAQPSHRSNPATELPCRLLRCVVSPAGHSIPGPRVRG